jgi:GNAT superfamily N-acetyltransferase
MEIIDLSEEYEDSYCKCLEDWSEEIAEAGDRKKKWLAGKKDRGLRVKLARTDDGKIVGMIHYIPIEEAPALGKELYYIYCVWVHGYKQGVGNHQKKGVGRALLAAAEEDARALGAKGMAAWGITLPFFMRSRWFKKGGYRKCDSDGMLELVWKPFSDDAAPPAMLKLRKKPVPENGFLKVTCLVNGWCPAQNLACERMKRAAAEYGDAVRFEEIDTEDRDALREWGSADALFVDDKLIPTGPPPSYAKLKRIVEKRIRKKGVSLQ